MISEDNTRNRPIIYLYVSKEYNVGPVLQEPLPGRFLILQTPFDDDSIDMLLVEHPADPYFKADLNVEFHYLRLREYIEPGQFY